jgi:hypothetical protein
MTNKEVEVIKINVHESFIEISIKHKGISYQGLLLKDYDNDKEIQTRSS